MLWNKRRKCLKGDMDHLSTKVKGCRFGNDRDLKKRLESVFYTKAFSEVGQFSGKWGRQKAAAATKKGSPLCQATFQLEHLSSVNIKIKLYHILFPTFFLCCSCLNVWSACHFVTDIKIYAAAKIDTGFGSSPLLSQLLLLFPFLRH